MTKDLGNIDECKRAIEDIREDIRKYNNILKHCYPEGDLENNSYKTILMRKNNLENIKVMLERRMDKYKTSKNEEPIPKNRL